MLAALAAKLFAAQACFSRRVGQSFGVYTALDDQDYADDSSRGNHDGQENHHPFCTGEYLNSTFDAAPKAHGGWLC